MNVGYSHSITDLENELLYSLKHLKNIYCFMYFILVYIVVAVNFIIFLFYYYER